TVHGNMVLATHGKTIPKAETLGSGKAQGGPRQRFKLLNAPLAHLDPKTINIGGPVAPAAPDPFSTRAPRSASSLQVFVDQVQWQQQPTLLTALPDSQVYRVEIDDEGEATVVFGDGVFGRSLPENAIVTANYRVGGGQIGNLGADTLVVPYPDRPAPWLTSVTNPLPAIGGRNLESRDHARRVGPPLSQQPLIAVSAADYQGAVTDFTDSVGQKPIQRAEASFRWTGSWLTVTLAVDPFGTEGLTPDLRQKLLDYLG